MKLFICILLFFTVCYGAPSVSVGVESRDACVGQSFLYQIKVSDADEVHPFHLPDIANARVQTLSPSQNQSSQVSIVNGKVKKIVNNDVLYNFRITPKKTGPLVIPSVTLQVGKETFTTQEITINVSDTEQVTDIVLEMRFSQSVCYVGQPVLVTWRLYLGRNASGCSFDLPLLEKEEFTLPQYEPVIDQNSQRRYLRIPIQNSTPLIGELHLRARDGIQTQYLEFSRPIIPVSPGEYTLDAGTVCCQIEDRSAKRTSRDPFFDSFFDRTPMKEIVIEGAAVPLEVRELPENGRPDNFSGIIGHCQVTATATPTEVNVGDPIVLTLKLTGPVYLDNVSLPPLSSQPGITEQFRLSDEEPGIIQDGAKIFQYTLRAKSASVTQIPPLDFCYFDAETGTYQSCETEAIPLTVQATHQMTLQEIQGTTAEPAPAAIGTAVKSLDDGLAHNYPCQKLLENQQSGFRCWRPASPKLIICAAALGLYFLLALMKGILWAKNRNPEQQQRHRNMADARQRLAKAKNPADMYDAFQQFLRARLCLPPGDISRPAVQKALEAEHISREMTEHITHLLETYEALSYSGETLQEQDLLQKTKQAMQV